MKRWAFVVGMVALLASCTNRPGDEERASTSPPSEEAGPSAAAAVPAEALPVPEPSPWAEANGIGTDHPRSSPALNGKPYRFQLYTHCGIDFRSFWQAYRRYGRPDNPGQEGTMTLLSPKVALFESGGGSVRIYFVRNDTPKPRVGCD